MKKTPGGIFSSDAFSFAQTPPPSGGSLEAHRAAAWEAYRSLPFPSRKDESWRRVDGRTFPKSLSLATESSRPAPESLRALLAEDSPIGTLLLSTGASERSLDASLAEKGVRFCDLRAAESKFPDLTRRLAGNLIPPQEEKFAALASAYAKDGALLYIPKALHVAAPFHLARWLAGEGAHFTRLLVFLDEGASATLVCDFASSEAEESLFHAGVVEISLAENASLHFVEMQHFGTTTRHILHERVRAARGASVKWTLGSLGARWTKTFLSLDLDGEGASGEISGFTFANARQQLNHETRQNHLAPRTESNLLFKNALKDESHSVWSGMIYVSPEAQKTDGYQSSHTLLLSENARADSIPGLEILADDVRCSHGATVGKIDENILFYLLSRGIPPKEAERLAVEGFFEPVLEKISPAQTRERVRLALAKKILEEL